MHATKLVRGIRPIADLCILGLAALSGIRAGAAAQAIYEKEVLEVRADPGFGQGTDWADFIENEINSLARAPDGSLFLAQQRAHRVHKFDRSGRLVVSFGRQGQGPGDLQFPQFLSILDGLYLVVGERAESRRISLFDLEGRFVKVMKTGRGPFSPLALRGGVVAYVAKEHVIEGPLVMQATSAVLLDTESGKEVKVCDHGLFVDEPQVFASQGGSLPPGKFGRGEMVINRTADGDLIVGYTSSPKVVVFAPDGRRLREFELGFPAVRNTDEIWRRSREAVFELQLERNPKADQVRLRRAIVDTPRLSDFLPYFAEILTDAAGRILVVGKDACFRHCDPVVRVYTPEGRHLGQTVLRGIGLEAEIDRRSRSLIFADDGIYGVFLVKGSPDDERRLVRARY